MNSIEEIKKDIRETKAMFERLQRIEARMVRGFTEMGVRVMDDQDWCRIDTERRRVFLKGAGKSIKAIQLAIARAGGACGDDYEVFLDAEKIATVRA